MPLSTGTIAPDFTLPAASGAFFSLSGNMRDKACILYFYPRDFTRVCTREACGFRDWLAIFRESGVDVIGISRDNPETHLKFKETYDIPFELLSDTDGKIAGLYKAAIPWMKITRRITYLLDRDHKIAAVCENMFNAKAHINKMTGAAAVRNGR